MITTPAFNGFVELTTTDPANTLRRIGTEQTERISRVIVPQADADNWEEAAPTPFTTAAYEAEVERLIRTRYSVSAELAILRQRDTKPDEFETYNTFAESCKAEARAALASKTD